MCFLATTLRNAPAHPHPPPPVLFDQSLRKRKFTDHSLNGPFWVHWNNEKSIVNQHNMVRLKIPTGRRQTSIYKRGRGVELRTTKKNTSLVVTVRLAPAILGFQVRSSNQSARISSPTEFPYPPTLESSFTFLSSLHSLLFLVFNSHLLLPLRTFLPISHPDATHLLHLWRLFWARYRKTSRYEIPSSLIWYFSVTKYMYQIQWEDFAQLFSLSKQVVVFPLFSHSITLPRCCYCYCCYSWFAESQSRELHCR